MNLSFGQWLKQRRRALDLTQDDLARRVSCSNETIRKIEADTRRPSKQLAELLAEQLDLPIESRPAFLQFARTGSPRDAPNRALPPPPPAPALVPVPPTRLIGRAQELAAIREHLQTNDVRLITLLGPPGVGKTRLSLEVGSELRAEFSDGVYFVALASVQQPELVANATAQTLGVKETASESAGARLRDYLRDKHMLLLLDNFEQVADAAPFVAELLASCARLKVVVTSRAPLRVRGEIEFPVAPLTFPDAKKSDDMNALSDYPAVALFVERARAGRPDFSLTADNAAAVTALCARVDGLPLAIELIAARVKLLAPQMLLERLGSRMLLTGEGPRDLPARHRTLQNAIHWSYDLLDAAEQTLFARLAVFRGGAMLDAVDRVCADPNDTDNLERMASLLDKNLVRREESAGTDTRLGMLETIREFANERLVERGTAEVSALRQKHAEYFLALAETVEPQVRSGAEQAKWLDRLERDHENLRAASRWFVRRGQIENGLRLGRALWIFWYLHGHWSEGRQQLAELLALADEVSPESIRDDGIAAGKAGALTGAGFLATVQNEYDTGRALLDESVVLWRALAARQAQDGTAQWGLAYALGRAGFAAQRQADFATAYTFYQESWTLMQELGDAWGLCWSTSNLGRVAIQQGDLETARVRFEQALELWRALGNQEGIAAMFTNLGEVARGQGEYERAIAFYEQSLTLARRLGNRSSIPILLMNLGNVANAQGDADRAVGFFQESLELYRELGNKSGIANALAGLGGVLVLRGEPRRAATVFGAVTELCERNGIRFEYLDRVEFERNVAAARAQLKAAEFDAAWAVGRALTLREVVALVYEGE